VELEIIRFEPMTNSIVAIAQNPLHRDIGADSAGDSYDPGSGNGGYDVLFYDLTIDYRINTNRIAAVAVISLKSTQRLARFSLDLVGLTATNVQIDGSRASRYHQTPTKLIITPARPVLPDAEFIVTIRYGGAPSPRRSAWGDVGWEELSDGVLVAGQPSGAPTWFPCNDHPSSKAAYRITVTLGSSYRVIANGRLVSTTNRASRTQWVYESLEPMATYLATVQIGMYRTRATSAESIPQFAYIPTDLSSEFDADFASQPQMVETFEKLFGPYPFGQYSVVVTDDELEIPLEAQGLSIFGRNHVDGEGGSLRLIAHELAHSWFGNSLTNASWQHIWLHEGFACYAEWLWSEASKGPKTQRLAEQHWSRLNSLQQDFAIGDPGPELMFDDRLYKRGALTLHALRLTVGDTAFFRMLRSWTAQNRHGSVTTEQFIAHAEASTGVEVRPLLEEWLFEHALPRLPKKR
jgi:aminopeptidase N